MKDTNGWKRIVFVCTTIVAVSAAVAVLEPYHPWAPRITFSMAAENTRTRLFNDLTALVIMLGQAEATNNEVAQLTLKRMIAEKKEQIADLERKKAKHE